MTLQHVISGLSLTNDNYYEVVNSLKNRYGNKQMIISAHINTLVKLPKVLDEDVKSLRKFYDDEWSLMFEVVNVGHRNRKLWCIILNISLRKAPP